MHHGPALDQRRDGRALALRRGRLVLSLRSGGPELDLRPASALRRKGCLSRAPRPGHRPLLLFASALRQKGCLSRGTAQASGHCCCSRRAAFPDGIVPDLRGVARVVARVRAVFPFGFVADFRRGLSRDGFVPDLRGVGRAVTR